MELQRIEKSRKDAARKEALRIANEERRLAKDAKKKAEAIERQAAEQEFRQMLVRQIPFSAIFHFFFLVNVFEIFSKYGFVDVFTTFLSVVYLHATQLHTFRNVDVQIYCRFVAAGVIYGL